MREQHITLRASCIDRGCFFATRCCTALRRPLPLVSFSVLLPESKFRTHFAIFAPVCIHPPSLPPAIRYCFGRLSPPLATTRASSPVPALSHAGPLGSNTQQIPFDLPKGQSAPRIRRPLRLHSSAGQQVSTQRPSITFTMATLPRRRCDVTLRRRRRPLSPLSTDGAVSSIFLVTASLPSLRASSVRATRIVPTASKRIISPLRRGRASTQRAEWSGDTDE
jgi:hypothetical protein